MNLTVLSVAASIIVAVFLQAEISPHDLCWDEGNPCDNALPDYASPGICRAFKHRFTVPGSDAVYEPVVLRCIATAPRTR